MARRNGVTVLSVFLIKTEANLIVLTSVSIRHFGEIMMCPRPGGAAHTILDGMGGNWVSFASCLMKGP